jgi:hypothetical protein
MEGAGHEGTGMRAQAGVILGSSGQPGTLCRPPEIALQVTRAFQTDGQADQGRTDAHGGEIGIAQSPM